MLEAQGFLEDVLRRPCQEGLAKESIEDTKCSCSTYPPVAYRRQPEWQQQPILSGIVKFSASWLSPITRPRLIQQTNNFTCPAFWIKSARMVLSLICLVLS